MLIKPSKIMERLKVLAPHWQSYGFCVKNFASLDVQIVKDNNWDYYLISTNIEGLGREKKIINFGKCDKKLDEHGVLVFLKDFCFAPLKGGISETSQNDFDVLLGYAVPAKVLRCEEFVECVNAELENMKKQVKPEEVEKKFAPLYASVELAVGAAKMEPHYDDKIDEICNMLKL